MKKKCMLKVLSYHYELWNLSSVLKSEVAFFYKSKYVLCSFKFPFLYWRCEERHERYLSSRWHDESDVYKRLIWSLYANCVGIEETEIWKIGNIFLLKAGEEAHGISHRNEKNGLNVRNIIEEADHAKWLNGVKAWS